MTASRCPRSSTSEWPRRPVRKLTDQTLYTEFGAVVGTVEYMSPEQAELNQLDIDTRSDIYSLGVLIYELLTGSTPLQRKRLKQAAVLEVLRLIREEEPPRPSLRISTTAELPSIAACRNVEPRKLSALMRGELDWIVMKALEKDRDRRYETANGLAADLRRYLDDEAVQACPPTAAYRLSKFAKKYRVALATACAFVAVLVGATVISVWQAVRANRARAEAVLAYAAETEQRREAQDQRDRAFKAEEDATASMNRARAAVDDYLTTISESRLLKSPLPGLQPLRKELLTTALKYYEDFLNRHQDDPGLQADLAAATLRVGEITDQIGSQEEALKAFQTALRMYESLAGGDFSPSSRSYRAGQARCLVRMAMIQDNQGHSEESLKTVPTINRPAGSAQSRPARRRGHPRRSGTRASLPGQDAHEEGKSGRVAGSPASGHRTSQKPRRGVPETVVASRRPGVELEQSGRDPYASGKEHRGPRFGPRRQRDPASLGRGAPRRPSVSNPRWPSAPWGWQSTSMSLGRWKESRPLHIESVEIMSRVVAENPAVTEFRASSGEPCFSVWSVPHRPR